MKYNLKRVLVTGAAGCIGMAVCKELLRRNVQVVFFDLYEQINRVKEYVDSRNIFFFGSILDKSSLREAIRGCDAVIHLAAYLGVRRTELNRLRCLEINIEGTKNVLDAAIQSKMKKIVFASSSEVYGEPSQNPVTEETVTQGKTIYAISKLAGEELVKAYNAEHNSLNYTILRYFNTYGPFQIAQFVIPKFIHNVLKDKPPIIYGNGKQKRSYNFSEDTARGTVDALYTVATDNLVLNIGNSDELISLVDLAQKVIHISGKKDILSPKILNNFQGTDRNRSREIFHRYCSTEKAKNIIGYESKVPLEVGIEKVISRGVLQPKWATSEKDYTIDDALLS